MAMDSDFYIKVASALGIVVGIFIVMPILLFRGKHRDRAANEIEGKGESESPKPDVSNGRPKK